MRRDAGKDKKLLFLFAWRIPAPRSAKLGKAAAGHLSVPTAYWLIAIPLKLLTPIAAVVAASDRSP